MKLTTAEAAALLAARGVLIRVHGETYPPRARHIAAWCRSGALPATSLGSGTRATWQIEQDALDTFTPPAHGRPWPSKESK